MNTTSATAGPITWMTRASTTSTTCSPELAATFPDTLARMRSRCPVAHSDQYGGFWVVHDDVAPGRPRTGRRSGWPTGLDQPVAPVVVRNLPVEVDPPLQRVDKRLINTHLTPAAVEQRPVERRQRAPGRVTRLIDDFVERGQ